MSYIIDDDENRIQELTTKIDTLEIQTFSPEVVARNQSTRNTGIQSGDGAATNPYPLWYPIRDFGSVGLLTLDITLNRTDSHVAKLTATGDIDFAFSLPPGTNKMMWFILDVTVDAIGGYTFNLLNNILPAGITIDNAANARTVIRFTTTDAGVTYYAEDLTTGGSSGDVSQWATFPAVADINFATFDGTTIDRLRFVVDSGVPVLSSDPSIFLDVGGFMNLNVGTNNGTRIKSNNVEIARFQSSTQIGLIMGTNADIRLEGNELFLDTTDTSFIDANTPNSLRLTTNSTVALTIGTASIIPSRDIIFSNILSNVLKMSGKDIFLDVDNDTLIDSTTDDSLRFTVGGSPRLTITNTAILPTHDISFTNALSNVLRMQGKDVFLDADNDTSIDSVNDDSIRIITGGSPRLTITNTAILPTIDISFTNALTHVLRMNGKAIFLDTDNDSSISSVSDDTILLATGGSLELAITNGFVTVPNSLIINGNTTLGDSAADSVTFNADTIGNITANVDNTDSIGNLARTYAFGYFKGGVGIVEGYATGFKPSGQTNTGIHFTVPTGAGKTEARVSFQTGVSQVYATEP